MPLNPADIPEDKRLSVMIWALIEQDQGSSSVELTNKILSLVRTELPKLAPAPGKTILLSELTDHLHDPDIDPRKDASRLEVMVRFLTDRGVKVIE